MWQLYHFPLCPFSRKVRLVLSEKRVAFSLKPVCPWQREPELLAVNRIGRTPAMRHSHRDIVLADSQSIAEYFDETVPGSKLLRGSAEQRAEVRRLIGWADDLLFREVVRPLLASAFDRSGQIGPLFDAPVIEASRQLDPLLDELGYLLGNRAWLAGAMLSLADYAVAAHLSVADYFGVIDWRGDELARTWYSVLKSRPSFQPLLTDRMKGVEPPPHYSAIDN